MDTKPKTSLRFDDPNVSSAGAATQPQATSPTDPIQAVVERARNGDASALPELEKILKSNPEIWQRCHDLVALTEQGWIEKISGKDLVLGQSIRRQLQELKQRVAGPTPSPLEKLLADRIGASWLAVQHAELSESCGETTGFKVAQLKLKRMESANRRFLAAVKSLAVVRRLTNGLQVSINHIHQGGGPASTPTGQSAAVQPAHDRIRGLFDQNAAEERRLALMARS